jgi:hypothetical protein
LNVERDTAGVRKILWVEAEDRNITFVEFAHDGVSVLVMVVRDN